MQTWDCPALRGRIRDADDPLGASTICGGMEVTAGEEYALPVQERLRLSLAGRGYSEEDVARQIAKYLRGRAEHGEDLHGLDYLGEMTQEADDLAVYLALWQLHGGPRTPTVAALVAAVRRVGALLSRLRQECNYPLGIVAE